MDEFSGKQIRYLRQKDAFLRHRYGIGLLEYNEMHKQQGGACALCRCKPNHTLHVDHDHITKRVRGLLCNTCNTKLAAVDGLIQNCGGLERLVAYLLDN